MPPIRFETHPSRYRHWKLSFDGPVARLAMDVQEEQGLRPGYVLKLNSYDLGVDIELADAIQRLRFEHPEVRALVVESGKGRIFCSGANIYMLGLSSHAFKVNFCKFTNETRLGLEDYAAECGVRTIASLNGVCAGGGYELALACDEIVLQDDGNSAVSLPEVTLLGVLPGTGGLTRVVDKRKVRRDRADVFNTVAEGIKGKRAQEWGLVDAVVPASRFAATVQERARKAAEQPAPHGRGGAGVALEPLGGSYTPTGLQHRHVSLSIEGRVATLLIRGPEAPPPASAAAARAQANDLWLWRCARELDDALLELRFNRLEVGLVVVKTQGSIDQVLAHDRFLAQHAGQDWFLFEVRQQWKRALKRLDLTARSLFALVEPGSCFAGTLFEVALACDRAYMLDDPAKPNHVALSVLNRGAYPMSNGLTRLATRFLGDAQALARAMAEDGPHDPQAALEAGLVTLAPDDIDYEDEVRIAIEERASLSPDALTGLEANLRFAGPETLETKIFGRLSAWQNWIFTRPNATGELGALTLYGRPERPVFDWRRT
ncbi:MAG: 2,3-epoxybenzoyl-CoA dihydrolase [Planctomycetia bacterium]